MSLFNRSGRRGPSRGRKGIGLLLGQAIRLYLHDRRKPDRRGAVSHSCNSDLF
jgi:hypothetical protein